MVSSILIIKTKCVFNALNIFLMLLLSICIIFVRRVCDIKNRNKDIDDFKYMKHEFLTEARKFPNDDYDDSLEYLF